MGRRTIGVIIPVPDGFYFGDILWGIANEANRIGVNVLVIGTAHAGRVGGRIEFDSRVGWEVADAWIIVGEAVTPDYVEKLAATGRPIVSVAENFTGLELGVVKCDNYGAAAELARHLIEAGRTRAAFIGQLSNADCRERLAGFADAYREAGLTLGPVYDVMNGEEGAERILADGMPASAIFAATDSMAAACVQRLTAAGIRIPEDVAVAGFDDGGIAKKCKPNLTTVRQPIIDLGTHAVRLACDILSGSRERNAKVLLPVRLIVRESSGAAQPVERSENDQTLSWRSIPGEELEQLIESHRRISLRLIDAQDMSWLRWTNQYWGCVSLWTDEHARDELRVDAIGSIHGDAVSQMQDERFRVEQFPPLPAMLGQSGEPEAVLVQQVSSETRKWGLLATAGPVNDRFIRGYDTRQFPSLLGAVYDNRALLEGLEQREAGYAALAEKLGIVSRTTNDGVYELDFATSRIEWFGSGIETILGVKKDELPADGRALQRLFHPDDERGAQLVWEAHLRYRTPFRIEARVRRGGEYVWISSVGEALFDEEQRPVRFIGSISDIHSRKTAENALLASEERYRAFFHNTPVMMLSLDDKFAVIDANPYWLEAMGYERKEVVGTSCLSYMTRQSVKTWAAYWRTEAADESGTPDMELQWVTREGRIIDGLVNYKRFEEADTARIYLSVRDITERKRAERQIHYLAYHDPLTGLPNRRAFHDRLEEALRQAAPNAGSVTVMLIDLDHFKVINDSLGHDRGDRLLRLVANLLEAETGEQGVVARIGGDEFMVLMAEEQDGGALELADTIITRLQMPFAVDGYDLYATASIGISRYPDNGTDGAELVKMADTAMYRAKQLGRNRYAAYSRSMEEGVRERLSIGSRLRLAADTLTEFQLVYQPQIDVATGRLTGMEALLRWNPPDLGSVPPSTFIPLAEEIGLIVPIGSWVLHEACLQLRMWDERFGHSEWHMSVNLSARQLQQPEFLASVDHIISITGVSPERLIFEVTETAALHNLESCVHILNELRDRGVRIALDDFGTGYSSLLMLRELPLSFVKIDRSFIRDIGEDRSNAPIVRGIIAMSKELGMTVIAEGVEDGDQLALLRSFGCDRYQGYYASRPVPADQFERSFFERGAAGTRE